MKRWQLGGARSNAAALLSIVLMAATMLPTVAAGSGGAVTLDHWPEQRGKDNASLQNGARLFSNYCLSCHGASLMRWNRLRDIGLDEKQIKAFLIFGNQKAGDMMTVALNPKDAKAWFGKVPPDLSVITKARTTFEYKGTDYLYTLLRGYYRDNGTPTGWNNVVYPNIAMPHILWERQGPRAATITKVVRAAETKSTEKKGAEGGHGEERFERVVSVFDADGNATVTTSAVEGHAHESVEYAFKPADEQAAKDFDADVADLVGFLQFMTDPAAASYARIGVWVMLFLVIFTAVAWRMNAVYWKRVR